MRNDITNLELAERLEIYILALALLIVGALKPNGWLFVLGTLLFAARMYANHLQGKRICLENRIDDLPKS